MELVDVDAARRLVEPIDVLGHHGLELARLLQLRQLQMGSIGLGVGKEHLVVVEAVELLRILLEEGVAQNGLRGILVLLVVQAVHAAEIRDAALGGHARPAEKDDILTLVDPFLELFQFLIHTKPLLTALSGGGSRCGGSWSSRRSRTPACPSDSDGSDRSGRPPPK